MQKCLGEAGRMARKKQGGPSNHRVMNNPSLRSIALATALFACPVFAEEISVQAPDASPASPHHRVLFAYNSLASPVSTPGVTDGVPSLSFDSRALAPENIPFKSISPAEWRNRAPDTPIREADLISNLAGARVVFSMPPSTSFSYDSHYPVAWYPSVSFRF